AILCLDDAHVRELIPGVDGTIVTYAISADFSLEADYRAEQIVCGDRVTRCQIWHKREHLGELMLTMSGKHNIANALAAIIVCLEAGLPFSNIAAA
ncbi:Mur ligase family protein, partial [Frankia sp. Cpl3]|nr:Mur ligase family protein [Frankia sp. Cpl3]